MATRDGPEREVLAALPREFEGDLDVVLAELERGRGESHVDMEGIVSGK